MNIWKKISLKKVDKKENIKNFGFNSTIWLKKINKKISLNISHFKKKKYYDYYISSSPIPWILLNENKQNIKILDFGSGFQEVFFQLINLKSKNKFIIDSIEEKNVCLELKKINFFKKKKVKINFYDEVNFNKKYDYIHISDSLQYIINWKKFLNKIKKKKPKFIILNNLTAGNFKTYFTEQNFYGDKLTYIFFNLDKVKKVLKNYDIVHKSLFLNKIKNKYSEYPQQNFNKKDKLGFPKTLVFRIKD